MCTDGAAVDTEYCSGEAAAPDDGCNEVNMGLCEYDTYVCTGW